MNNSVQKLGKKPEQKVFTKTRFDEIFFNQRLHRWQIACEKLLIYTMRELQIKTTIYHYACIILDCKNTGNTKRWSGCGTTGTFTLPWGMQNRTATLEDTMVVSYKTKHALNIQSNSTTFSYSLQGIRNLCQHK